MTSLVELGPASRSPVNGSATMVFSGSSRRRKSYQACEGCRKRKAKCELDGGDGAIATSCIKCRRERRKCVFSAERSIASSKPRRSRATDSGTDTEAFSANNHPERTLTSQSINTGGRTPEECMDVMIHTEVRNQNDTLGLLFDAALYDKAAHTTTTDTVTMDTHMSPQSSYTSSPPSVPPTNIESEWFMVRNPLSCPSEQVLDAWRTCPLVKRKWLSAQEAVSYVDLFFAHLAPMSTILDNYFASHQNHQELITKEPILCCTILAISSRYHFLAGVASLSRGFLLHERLWEYCQSLMQTAIWGQDPMMIEADQVVGVIESIFLLTEWHPRSSLSGSFWSRHSTMCWREEKPAPEKSTIPSDWFERVVEPARLADRMSWMLLGSAVALAHSIDLVRISCDEDNSTSAQSNSQGRQPQRFLRRCQRARRLLFIYISQLSSRIGCSISNMPFHSAMHEAIHGPAQSAEPEWDDFMSYWIDLTRILRSASEILFSSKQNSNVRFRNAQYVELRDHFLLLLQQWFEKQPDITGLESQKELLLAEYNYVRIYINSITLQAISKRTTESTNSSYRYKYEINAQESNSLREIIESCKAIFHIVIGLQDSGRLKYIPNRFNVRIASAAMYFIKALAFGIRSSELNSCLKLLDRSLQALRLSSVDDIHLSAHYATLLEHHMQSLRNRFVPVPNLSTSDISRAPMSFNPFPISPGLANLSTAAVVDNIGEFDGWMVLPFDPSVVEPFEQGIAANLWGLDVTTNPVSFWDSLP